MAGLKRGDIHYARFGKPRGREQAGTRPAVILQAPGMAAWSTVLLAPLSTSAHPTSFRPEVTVRDTATRVLVDQVRPLDLDKVGRRLGSLTVEDLLHVEAALRTVLGLR